MKASRSIILTMAAVVAVAGALSACSSMRTPRLFKPKEVSEAVQAEDARLAAEKGARVPLLALDDQLKVADALKGVGFSLPAPQPLAECPLPGCSAEQSVEHVAAAPNFQVAWSRKIGNGSKLTTQVVAPPIMAEGHIFTMDGNATVSALDPRSGQVVWRTNLSPKIKRDKLQYGGGLAYAGGRLYVSSGYRFVASLVAANGAVLWNTQTRIPIHSAPTVSGGKVFVSNLNNELITFDAVTGTPGWQYQALAEPARLMFASSPAVSGDAVIAAFASGEMVALRTANGTELWSGALNRMSRTSALSEIRDIAGRPVIYKGMIYAGSHAGVFAGVDLRTGTPRWQLPVTTMATPWAAGDVVYTVSKAGEVICVARESGQVYWIRDLNEGRRSTRTTRFLGREVRDRAYWTGVVLASNRLISVSSDGRAVAIDPKTGDVQGYIKLGGRALITPMAVGGMVYVMTDEAKLVAIG